MYSLVQKPQTEKNQNQELLQKCQKSQNLYGEYYEIQKDGYGYFTLPNRKYKSSPSIQSLMQMNYSQLQNIQNFTLSNEFGKIQWTGTTDLTYVNLQKDVLIHQNMIEVYPDNLYQDKYKKPQIGQKLNKKCMLWYYKIEKPKKYTKEEFIDYLKNRCAQQEARFINYDLCQQTLQIEVFHFTAYQFDEYCENIEEDSDEEQDITFTHQNTNTQQEESKKAFDKMQHQFQQQQNLGLTDNNNESDDQFIKEEKEEVTEIDILYDKNNLLSQPSLEVPKNNKKFMQSKEGQQQIISFPKKQKVSDQDFEFKQDNEYFYEDPAIEDNLKQKKINQKLDMIESKLMEQATVQQDNQQFIVNERIQNNVISECAFINKVLQSDIITENSKGMTKDIEVPICFMNDNQCIMLDNKIFQNRIKISSIEQFEIQRKANDIMNDIVTKLLSDLTMYFFSQKNKITEALQEINFNSQQNLNKQDLFFILFMFNLQKNLQQQKFAFWFLYVKLVNDLFLGPFCSQYNKLLDLGDFDCQIEQLQNFYQNQHQYTETSINDIRKTQLSNWCHFAEDLVKYLNQSQFVNDKFYEIEYDFNISSIDQLIQPKQDMGFVKGTTIHQLKKMIKKERQKNLLQLFEALQTQESSQHIFLDQLFVKIMDIYISSELTNVEVESFVLLDEYCKQNKIYFFFQHLLFQAIYFRNLSSINNKQFEQQYQWNYKNLEYFLNQNEFNIDFIIISNMMVNSNFLNTSQLKQKALYQYGPKVILQRNCQKIIKFLYGQGDYLNTLSQTYLANNKIEKYLEFEKCNEERLNVFVSKIIKIFLSPISNRNSFKLYDLLHLWDKYFQHENQPKYKAVFIYLSFIEAFEQENLHSFLENFHNFVIQLNMCYDQNSLFFHEHEETLRQMQTQMFQKMFNFYKNKNRESKKFMQSIKNLNRQNLQFFVENKYIQQFTEDLLKLDN